MTDPVGPSRRYSGKSTQERAADRRDRLLDAAKSHMGAVGFAATPVERICSTAKVSTRHFYQLYENKESLFIDLYDKVVVGALDDVVDSLAVTAGRPIRERLPEAMRAYVAPMIEDSDAARIAFIESLNSSPRIEEKRLEFREALVLLVESEGRAAVERGEILDRDFRFAALALWGATNAIVYDWALTHDRSAESLEDSLVALSVKLLLD